MSFIERVYMRKMSKYECSLASHSQFDSEIGDPNGSRSRQVDSIEGKIG